MMIVVQFFPAEQNSPRHDVGGSVRTFEVAIAGVMPESIDNAGRKQRHRNSCTAIMMMPGTRDYVRHRNLGVVALIVSIAAVGVPASS